MRWSGRLLARQWQEGWGRGPHLDVGPHVLGVRHPLQEGDQLEQLLIAVVVVPAGGEGRAAGEGIW